MTGRTLRGMPALLAGCCLLLGCARPAAAVAEPTVPVARGFVSDYAGVIDGATVRYLDGLIGELKAKTGAEIAVVVVNSTAPLTAFDYAMKIAEAWKPGAKGKDNGIVFLVAVKDRKMFILTGYGVEGVLPDGRVGEIRDRLVRPAFRRGDYAAGIRAATEAMAGIIAGEAGVRLTGVRPAPVRRRGRRAAGAAFLPLLLIILFFSLFFRFPLFPLLFLGGARGFSRGGFGGFGGGFSGGGGGFGGFGGGGFGGGGAGGGW
ncbi:MAG: TPM domain-containing protein [Candidatus Binatia bacterium]